MFSIKSLVLLLTIYGVRESKQSYFRSDYSFNQDAERWMKFHKVPGTWHEARNRCYMEGAILASPLFKEMHKGFRDVLNESSTECTGIHIGVHSLFSKGYFYTLEGIPLSKLPVQWLPGEPDNVDNNEDCIAYVDGRIADVKCSEVLPFLCYNNEEIESVGRCKTIDRAYELNGKTGSCYKFHNSAQTWRDAFKVCSAEGGYLAIINSREEAAVLKEIYSRHNPSGTDIIYIGFMHWNKDLVWRTVDGETLEEAGYADWEMGQPDNASPGKSCGAMSPNAKLDDFWCDRPRKFLCEKYPKYF